MLFSQHTSGSGQVLSLILIHKKFSLALLDHAEVDMADLIKQIRKLDTFKPWLRTSFQNRNYFLLSNTSIMAHGVPQGLIYEPLLFVLNVVPLGHMIQENTTISCNFADDTDILP